MMTSADTTGDGPKKTDIPSNDASTANPSAIIDKTTNPSTAASTDTKAVAGSKKEPAPENAAKALPLPEQLQALPLLTH
jgi:hypothetical protein